jgi:hypothetical protein
MRTYIDCACVIVGDRYPWRYVENLYSMLSRHLSVPVKLHVFTEADRSVPDHMVHHALRPWNKLTDQRKLWWYKLQIFDPVLDFDRLLYFDLDVIITASLDWVLQLDEHYFWAIHDWKSLWKPHWTGLNSSMMYWNHQRFRYLWHEFDAMGLDSCIKKYHGDQDFLSDALRADDLRFFDTAMIKSWRWQIKDGGMDPKTRRYRAPGTGSQLSDSTAVMVFHGSPKPHELSENSINQLWNLPSHK